MSEARALPLHMQREQFHPVDEIGRLRDSEGISKVPSMFGGPPSYLITRYEDVRAVLADTLRFSSARFRRFAQLEGSRLGDEEHERMRAGQLLALDPPGHTRLRRMLAPEFTVRRMHRLQPRIVEIVDAALDDVERDGRPADPGVDSRPAGPVARDLRAPRRALRRPR